MSVNTLVWHRGVCPSGKEASRGSSECIPVRAQERPWGCRPTGRPWRAVPLPHILAPPGACLPLVGVSAALRLELQGIPCGSEWRVSDD